MHDVHRDSLIAKGKKRKVKNSDHDHSHDEHAHGDDHGHDHGEKDTGLTAMMSILTTMNMITVMTLPLPMATNTTMMKMPTKSMITIFIPTTMDRITNTLKSEPLPICMNTAMIFFMYTITPTIPNMQVSCIKFSVIL